MTPAAGVELSAGRDRDAAGAGGSAERCVGYLEHSSRPLVSLAFVSCEQPTEPLAHLTADTNGPTLTFFTSRSDFLTQFPALALEAWWRRAQPPSGDTP